jgi:histidine triad (HIT) family protein
VLGWSWTLFHHTPPGYVCPFCAVVAGQDNAPPHTQQSDVVWRTGEVTAFINARWWPNNPGHVLVVPNEHVENLYDLVPSIAVPVHEGVRQVALALKHVYRCDGVSTRQHNEPAGHQEVWHYHVHVFPRYEGDDLYPLHNHGRYTDAAERAPYAERLRAYFAARGE